MYQVLCQYTLYFDFSEKLGQNVEMVYRVGEMVLFQMFAFQMQFMSKHSLLSDIGLTERIKSAEKLDLEVNKRQQDINCMKMLIVA